MCRSLLHDQHIQCGSWNSSFRDTLMPLNWPPYWNLGAPDIQTDRQTCQIQRMVPTSCPAPFCRRWFRPISAPLGWPLATCRRDRWGEVHVSPSPRGAHVEVRARASTCTFTRVATVRLAPPPPCFTRRSAMFFSRLKLSNSHSLTNTHMHTHAQMCALKQRSVPDCADCAAVPSCSPRWY